MAYVSFPAEPPREETSEYKAMISKMTKCTTDTECNSMTVNGVNLTGRKCINGVCSCRFSYGGTDCSEDTCGLTHQDGGCVDSTVGTCDLQDDGSYKCACVVSRTGEKCQLCSQATQNVSGLICVHTSCIFNTERVCSGNGICWATKDSASCQCFPGYNGMLCEDNSCAVYVSSNSEFHYCNDHGVCKHRNINSERGQQSFYSCECFPGVSGDKCDAVTNYSQLIMVLSIVLTFEIVALTVLIVFLILRIRRLRRANAKVLEDSIVD